MILIILIALAEGAAVGLVVWAVDWGEYKEKRRRAYEISRRTQRKAEVQQEIKDDTADRDLRMIRGEVPNVGADMESKRRPLTRELSDIIVAESEPSSPPVRADGRRFAAKCIAALLALTGIGLGLLLSSFDEEEATETTTRSVVLVTPQRIIG